MSTGDFLMSVAPITAEESFRHPHELGTFDLATVSSAMGRFLFEENSPSAFDIGSVRGLEPVFESIADQIETLIDFDRLTVSLRLGSSKAIEAVYVRGIAIESSPSGWSGSPLADFPSDFLDSDGALLVSDILDIPHFAIKEYEDVGLRTWLELPLGPARAPIGWIGICSRAPDHYGPTEIQILKDVANFAAPAIQQTSLVETALSQARQARNLSEISRLFSSASDLVQGFQEVAKLISEILPADRLVLAYADLKTEETVDEHIWGVRLPGRDARRVHAFTPAVRHAISTKRGLVDDGSEAFETETLDHSLQSGLLAPLIIGDDVLGIISVKSVKAYAYGPQDLKLFESIASQIAGVTRLHQLNRQVESQSDRFRTLAELSRAIGDIDDMSEACALVIVRIKQIFNADCAAIYLCNENNAGDTLFSKADSGLFKPLATHPWSQSPQIHPDDSGAFTVGAKRFGVRSIMSVPFGEKGQTSVGHLVATSNSHSKFSKTDLEYFSLVGAQLAPAIQNRLAQMRELRAAEDRLKLVELDATNKRLESEAHFKSDLIAMVSHDLRTPLNSVTGSADLLQRNKQGNLTERQLRQIRAIQAGSRTLSFLISDLLAASSMEANQLELNVTTIDMDQFLADLESTFKPIFDSRNQTLRISTTARHRITADRLRLLQILGNLASNASKYSEAGKTVVIEILDVADGLRFDITDQGLGISPEDQPHLFDSYFRGRHLPSKDIDGVGLGLFIVKKLVDLHGGTISVDSTIGVGSTFSVVLPQADMISQEDGR